jgi:lipoprotein-anchoring transpeptidase ErfK/SrfK
VSKRVSVDRMIASVVAACIALAGCSTSSSSTTAGATSATAQPTFRSEVIDTPEGLITTLAPVSTLAPGYLDYEPGTTVVAYLQKGEENVEVFADATDSTPSQTIERINGRTLPFVALGNTPDRIRVLLPARPNGSVGWIDRTKLELRRNDWRIDINRETFTLTVSFENRVKRQIKIGIGDEETPTPKGVYYTLYSAKPKTVGTVFGAFVIGLSGFSEVLSADFNGSEARLGLHGTNKPALIGSKVSKGCIRMDDVDITYLVENLPLGTPVHVIA